MAYNPPQPIIQVRDLFLDYNRGKANELHVLKGMSFDVNRGEVICILGPSGTGKSSLIRCLNGLTRPTKGHVFINGIDIYSPKEDIHAIRQDIGFVFQHFELFPHMSVLDNVSLALRKVKHVPVQIAEDKAMIALKKVGMAEKSRMMPADLSGGQKQRVAIARALAQDPKIILFDEPTSALDPELIGEVLKVMEDIAREGMTMLVVTHELDFARRVCKRVLYLDQGKIWEQGTPDVILSNPREERTREFLHASHLLGEEITESQQQPRAKVDEVPIIKVKNLYLNYNHGKEDEVRVIKGISFEVYKGDVLCILGPSGTGKSSLIRCLNGLTTPSYGDVLINGVNIYKTGVELEKVRQDIGFVFQHFELFPHMSVLDNVSLALRKVKGYPQDKADEKAKLALRKVGMSEKVHAMPAELSGGQKQRVAIARALAQDPKIILFDEPTSALDPQLIGEVLAVMEGIAHEGMTMLVVTHEIDFAKKVGTRVFFLDQGKIWEQGDPAQVFTSPQKERTWQFLNASKLLRGKAPPASFQPPEYDQKSINEEYKKYKVFIDETSRFNEANILAHASFVLGVTLIIPFICWIVTGPLAIIFSARVLNIMPRHPNASFKAKFGLCSGIAQIVLFFIMLQVLCIVFPTSCPWG